MSEYQYYEFQAVDRPLAKADQDALRAISTRARITSTSFVNTYEWGDLKGDPLTMVRRWFDLHLYLTNWGTRRLVMRLPKRLVDVLFVRTLLSKVEEAEAHLEGDHLILAITRETEPGDDWDDGSGWLSALSPLRADVLGGDRRLFYLLWLMAVETNACEAHEREPLPSIAPMTSAHKAFAEFFQLDPDLLDAASERDTATNAPMDGRAAIAALADEEKTNLLVRLFDGEPHIGAELRAKIRRAEPADAFAARTVGTLRSRAEAIALRRKVALAERAADAERRRAEAAEQSRRMRMDIVKMQGEGAWREIEADIERRNASGYDKAMSILLLLHAIADDEGTIETFGDRLVAIRSRHERKKGFIQRLDDAAIA